MTSVQDPHSHPESHSRSDPDLPIVRSRWLDRLVFLGTGTSGQVPAIHCITSEGAPHEGADGAGASARNEGCETCVDAMRVGSRNRRGCTCVALIGGGGGSAGAGRRAEKR